MGLRAPGQLASILSLRERRCKRPAHEDPHRGQDHERRAADRQRGDADRRQRDAAQQRQAGAGEAGEQVVEAEQLAALGGARAVGERRRGGHERQVPADPEAEQDDRGGRHRLDPQQARAGHRHHHQPAGQRRGAADAVDQLADHQHQRVHAHHVRADDREDGGGGVVLVVGHHHAGQRHHAHHHRERGLAGEQGGDRAGAADDLAQRRRGRALGGGVGVQQLGDPLRVGPHEQHDRQRDEHEAAGRQPQQRERVAVERAPVQQRAEHERAEDRPEHGAEQHQRDPVRAMLGRVHVARRGAGEQRGAAGGADADQAREHPRGRLRRAAERGEPAAGRADDEAEGEDRHAAVAVHRPAGGQRGERAGGEHDRRPEPEQALDAEHLAPA